MLSILAQSFWMPLRNGLDVFRVFWPVMVLYAIWGALTPSIVAPQSLEEQAAQSSESFLISLSLMAYILVLLSSGSVIWSRKIVLSEKGQVSRLVPNGLDISYLWYTILFIIALIVYTVVAGLIITPVWNAVLTGQPFASTALQTTILSFSQPWLYNFLVTSLSWLTFFTITASLLFIFLIKSSVIVLPRIASGDRIGIVRFTAIRNHTRKWRWVLVLFTVVLASSVLLFGFFGLKHLIFNHFGYSEAINIGASFLFGLTVIYTNLIFTSLLALFYRDRVRPDMRTA